MNNGLYLPNGTFVRFSEADTRVALARDIATRERMNLGMQWFLPNPDTVLRKLGQSIQVYRDLTKDPAVGGLVRRRRSAVLRLARGLDPDFKGPARVRKDVAAMLGSVNVAQIIRQALAAPLYGYQPMEITWAIEAGRYMPKAVTAKPPEWFAFDQAGRLVLLTPSAPTGEQLPPYKFILATQDASYENPYGEADLAMCFWPVAFKRGGLKFWVKFTEKYGMPMVVGKLPRGRGTGHDADDLLDKLEQMVQDAVAVIPDDASVDLKEVKSGSGNAELYERLLLFCRSEISIALTGTNQTTEANSNRASATAGLEVADDIRDGDAEIAAAAINSLVRYYCALNHDIPEENVPVYQIWEPEDKDATRDRQAKRSRDMRAAGAHFTPRYFERAFGLEAGDLDAARMTAPSSDRLPADPTFAESALSYEEQDGLDMVLEQLAAQTMPGVSVAMLKPVLDALRAGADAKTAQAMLVRLLPDIDTALLQQSLAQLLFVADVVGRLSVQTELTA
ncbi:DUF935 domain-containing protein [Cupriavidus metallidurans]|uniref:DUF935 family protein n=1 Tax=Cupriavidus metallidurans TaxID=119219 RepID=A0A482IPJ1_9BURK|nr:DUF935 family protein [Cupriavidus metallidurans]QBP09842.1 DUF935 family protein [Cupriavidus metallidurans]